MNDLKRAIKQARRDYKFVLVLGSEDSIPVGTLICMFHPRATSRERSQKLETLKKGMEQGLFSGIIFKIFTEEELYEYLKQYLDFVDMIFFPPEFMDWDLLVLRSVAKASHEKDVGLAVKKIYKEADSRDRKEWLDSLRAGYDPLKSPYRQRVLSSIVKLCSKKYNMLRIAPNRYIWWRLPYVDLARENGMPQLGVRIK